MLLAIDTSTNYASLTLADGDTLLAELNWRVGQRHGSETLARARELMRGQGVEMSQLDGIAVALGPGSFNGVRVALATAKSLAFALDIPLYGVPTLDIAAWGARLSADPIWSLLEAGRGEVYAACYAPAESVSNWGPQLLSDEEGVVHYLITTPDALARRINEPVVLTGEWRSATREALGQALGERARFTAPLEMRRGVWLAELATTRAREGAADDPRALEPLYLRRPAITTSARPVVAPAALTASERTDPAPNGTGGEETARAL